MCFLSSFGGGPTEGGGRDQDDSKGGVGVAKEGWNSHREQIQSDAEERLRETK